MPSFTLNTNVPADKITSEFVKSTSETVANILGKPEGYVCVAINAGQNVMFGGTSDPCATGTLMSLGGLGGSKNKSHASVLFKHIEKHLGIPGNRMYIHFVNAGGSDIGYNGGTF